MQEIVLLLSSLAGIATAAAVRTTASTGRGGGKLLTLGASSQIQNQIKVLRMERQILASTITRLYQSEEFDIPREYKEKMLARYQRQMGAVMAKLDKLEDAKRHPDLGPVGDGLITLMDQKLSSMDVKMHDMAVAVADIKAGQQQAELKDAQAGAQDEEAAVTTRRGAEPLFEAPVAAYPAPKEGVPMPKTHGSFEITTLTNIPARKPRQQVAAAAAVGPASGATAANAAEEAPAREAPSAPVTVQRRDVTIKPETGEIVQQITQHVPQQQQQQQDKGSRKVPASEKEEGPKAPRPAAQEEKLPGQEKEPQRTGKDEPAAAQGPEPSKTHQEGIIDKAAASVTAVRGTAGGAGPNTAGGEAAPTVTTKDADKGHGGRRKAEEEKGDEREGEGKEEEEEDDEEEIKKIMRDIARTIEKLDRAEAE